MPDLEIACFNAYSARIAAACGAGRIELCASFSLGGTTPSLSTFLALQTDPAQITPIHVMIRPRGGNFVYTDEEYQVMLETVDVFSHAGASGFVFGVLTASGSVNLSQCRGLVKRAQGKTCVFHKAFDEIAETDLEAQLQVLIDSGISAVLTSGKAASAEEGIEVLRKLITVAGGRIEIIIGGGVRSSNVEKIRDLGAKWLHSSAVTCKDTENVDEEEVKALKNLT
ncbi:Bgt-3522 [Blumeria graminis f. sp. tritici]|uniref:Copper homeostasis protein cutC homolog n=2 Tax=Blumeria graminis f. sp. tritici TaxID=62690 RepID=A0A061HG58_BLUGR|nr:CutC family [Blumeria graminis f. sp. tritici 96224]VDB86099.1 Bgt-3522 [Blumeria graminis f. sp. tritici]